MPAILFMDFAHNNWQAFRSKAQWSAVGQFRIGIGNQKSEWYGMVWELGYRWESESESDGEWEWHCWFVDSGPVELFGVSGL